MSITAALTLAVLLGAAAVAFVVWLIYLAISDWRGWSRDNRRW